MQKVNPHTGLCRYTMLKSGQSASQAEPVANGSAVKTHRIRLVPHLENARSLAFDPVIRELMPIRVPAGTTPSAAAASVGTVGPAVNGRPPALLLKIGRFTDRNSVSNANPTSTNGTAPTLTIAGGGGDVCSGKVAFKSKVVSRAHAEIWCEANGKVSSFLSIQQKSHSTVLYPRFCQ